MQLEAYERAIDSEGVLSVCGASFARPDDGELCGVSGSSSQRAVVRRSGQLSDVCCLWQLRTEHTWSNAQGLPVQ